MTEQQAAELISEIKALRADVAVILAASRSIARFAPVVSPGWLAPAQEISAARLSLCAGQVALEKPPVDPGESN